MAPAGAGNSYCIPAPIDGSYLRARIKFLTVLAAIGGFSGIVIGGIIAFLLKHNMLVDRPGLRSIGAELKRQTTGASSSLFDGVRETLSS